MRPRPGPGGAALLWPLLLLLGATGAAQHAVGDAVHDAQHAAQDANLDATGPTQHTTEHAAQNAVHDAGHDATGLAQHGVQHATQHATQHAIQDATGLVQHATQPTVHDALHVTAQHAVGDAARAAGCLSAADLLSCAALGLLAVPAPLPGATASLDLSHNAIAFLLPGGFGGLRRLHTLRLTHNRLAAIPPGAFANASGARLRLLDLSSNRLTALEPHYFQPLSGLTELRLFDNRLALVAPAALAAAPGLRRAYLSHNRLTHFPFFALAAAPRLALLDLSSNRLPRLPLAALAGLPPPLQAGLFLHANPLRCDCGLAALLRGWERRRLPSARLFRRELVCRPDGVPRGAVRLLNGYAASCGPPPPPGSVTVWVGAPLLLPCGTPLDAVANGNNANSNGNGNPNSNGNANGNTNANSNNAVFFWVAPGDEYVAAATTTASSGGPLRVLANGSLQIAAARERDAGVYVCVARDRRRNETREVNVTVLRRPDGEGGEPFNTGFTTLLGCVVSLLLVLVYLFLTPCRCPPWPPAAPGAEATPPFGGGEAQASILTPTPPASSEGPGRKVSTNKHVVFLEPIREQNGRPRAGPGLLGAEPQQRARDADSLASVFSDTPIVLP